MADGKWLDGLTGDVPVEEAARVALTVRFGVVRGLVPLAAERAFDDVEHVHQLRVGTRRAGAALTLLGDCLPKKLRKRAKSCLRSLRRAAGDARDWDVFLEGLADAKALQAAAGKPTLDFLSGYALGERGTAQERLVAAAAEFGPDFDGVCDALADAVGPPGGHRPQTFGDLADQSVGALFADFNASVDANPAEPADLHQLRIRGKRVRYAMELFAGCFPAEFRSRLYPAVEEMQEVFGDLQDAHVGVGRLEGLRDRVRQVMPSEWARLRPGLDGLKAALRRKIPARRKHFQTWREGWGKLREVYPVASPRAAEAV